MNDIANASNADTAVPEIIRIYQDAHELTILATENRVAIPELDGVTTQPW
jgi:hypothetical protein